MQLLLNSLSVMLLLRVFLPKSLSKALLRLKLVLPLSKVRLRRLLQLNLHPLKSSSQKKLALKSSHLRSAAQIS
jgi:hypothetical protein